ncbi:hypothetical protein CSQ96_14875 [Janthinobacterium sp. BJB412]|nr:hypothetical protein CSQ96_14875 [Janthinobacterium sp. BJB412]
MAVSGGKGRRLVCLLLAAVATPAAQAALFKYVDPATRVVSYTNFRPPMAGARELVLRPRSAPRRAAPSPAAGNARDGAPSPMLGMADFPRTGAERQRELDADRKHIISTELQAAEAELERLLAGRAPPERVTRHRGDVAALRRELARLR